MPLVSVIVPNYNHAPYLEERIDSILSQTFQDFELIILDDCSTDGSREIINGYRNHPRVSSVLLNDTNSGSTFRQWIKGIGAAAGEYIWIAESDDWCEPSFLQTMVNGLTGSTSCVAAYCQSLCILEANEIKWQSSHPLLHDYQAGQQFVEKYMLKNNAIFNASMCVWKKEGFKQVSQEFIQYRFCGDWLFWIEICRQGPVFVSGKLLNYFRKHDKDVSGAAYKTGFNFLEELRMFRYIRHHKLVSDGQYLAVMQGKYLDYRLQRAALPPARRQEIEASFSADQVLKKALQKYYLGWKTKHTIKTWILRPFSWKKVPPS